MEKEEYSNDSMSLILKSIITEQLNESQSKISNKNIINLRWSEYEVNVLLIKGQ